MGIITYIKNLKMHKKLLYSYFIMIIIPIVIIGIFFTSNTKNIILNYINQINKITIKQVKTNILNSFDSYLRISDNILTESKLIEKLTVEYRSDSQYLNTYVDEILNPLNRLLLRMPSQVKISFFTTNDTVVTDNNIVYFVDDRIREEEWYKGSIMAKGGNVVSLPYISKSGGKVFSISRLLCSTPNSKRNVVMRIEVPLEKVYNLMKEEGKNKNIFLLNENDRVFALLASDELPEPYDIGQEFNPIHSPREDDKYIFNNQEFIVLEESLASRRVLDGWRLVFAISPDTIMKDINNTIYFIIIICIVIVMITTLFIFLFSYKLTGRLRKLARSMSGVKEEGSLEVYIDYDGDDEIGELSRSFKEMMERINALISEVYLAKIQVKDMELEKKKAELNALQSQINPHFLFNTMESISMNSLAKGDLETCEIIRSFSKILRRSIEWGNDNTTIGQELDLVRDYLKVQKFRHRDKYMYEIGIDSNLYDLSIPKFTIQPVVENAIYHGLELKEGQGHLKIYNKRNDQCLEIVVEDDGIGIRKDILEDIQRSMDGEQGYTNKTRKRQSIGLMNIHHRLRLYYGQEYGIKIESVEGVGTKVTIKLPVVLKGGHDTNVQGFNS